MAANYWSKECIQEKVYIIIYEHNKKACINTLSLCKRNCSVESNQHLSPSEIPILCTVKVLFMNNEEGEHWLKSCCNYSCLVHSSFPSCCYSIAVPPSSMQSMTSFCVWNTPTLFRPVFLLQLSLSLIHLVANYFSNSGLSLIPMQPSYVF